MVVLVPPETSSCLLPQGPWSVKNSQELSREISTITSPKARPLPLEGRVTSQAFLARAILRIRAAAKIHMLAILTMCNSKTGQGGYQQYPPHPNGH